MSNYPFEKGSRRRLMVFILFNLFCFLIWFSYVEIKRENTDLLIGYSDPPPNRTEEFDPGLIRLNTIALLSSYCDSIFTKDTLKRTFPEIVDMVIRKRFFHGYSYYGKNNNPLAGLLDPARSIGVSAIVIPEDLVKYPNAACSQQSIVAMELNKIKGFPVRKVVLFDTAAKSGHFCYEVFYNNSWHFFDNNQEPDVKILKKYETPSVEFLSKNPSVIAEMYKGKDTQLFKDLIMSYSVGKTNEFPARNAYYVQTLIKYITITAWINFLIFVFYFFENNNKDFSVLIRKFISLHSRKNRFLAKLDLFNFLPFN